MSNFPSYYDPTRVGVLYEPDALAAISAGLIAREKIALVDRDSDKRWSALVSIDMLNDFVLKNFALPVTGAVADTRRAIELIYKRPLLFDEMFLITELHFRLQIRFSTWWVDENGNHPKKFTKISAEDVEKGIWRPVIIHDWSLYYVQCEGVIDVWPPHAIGGTRGAGMVPAFEEAIWWHSAARDTKPIPMIKGTVLESEFNGSFAPNVFVPGHPQGQLAIDALNLLGRYGEIYFVGQALDVCVIASLRQIIKYYAGRPDVLKRIYLIIDCTSMVFPNDVEKKKILDELESAGINIVTSKELMERSVEHG